MQNISRVFVSIVSKASDIAMPYRYADWINYRDVILHGLTSDARKTKIYSQNFYVSSRASIL